MTTPDGSDDDVIRGAVRHAVMKRLTGHRQGTVIDDTEQLLASLDWLEIIIEVELQCGCEYNPQHSFESGLTIATLSAAFVRR